ncbi:MAG: hypothetical protein AAGA92_03460 [Planctomycetota bacterium]
MAMQTEAAPSEFDWKPQPEGAKATQRLFGDFVENNPGIAAFGRRLFEETGTRLIDWVDHIRLADGDDQISMLEAAGFQESSEYAKVWVNDDGLFPTVILGAKSNCLYIKVDSVDDFFAAQRAAFDRCGDAANIEGAPGNVIRLAVVSAEGDHHLGIVERHGEPGFDLPETPAEEITKAAHHLERFRNRPRNLETEAAGFAAARELIEAAQADLGVARACDLWFQAERDYWMSRNQAARVQYARQQRLGVGWANHDHHTYRSGRESFEQLIESLELLGFTCRERFYAGREAGWGAQVVEQTDCGVTIFADVDLSPEEVAGDFAHQPLPTRDELGTVGLWCRLHGESFLLAGMHHLECQFDFEASQAQLAEIGVGSMAPFTSFPHLKQCFTEGEQWQIPEKRIAAVLAEGFITADEAESFRREGGRGSHLEILERNDGYKGFNQTGISDIILRTDPRNR